ncbi:GNAT family N-acetyltransferase [Flavobacterium sp. RHBU_3]|uniref:GNAT family N-acetyltransferase n=1 Tax=Flavobacterium sp. RHBU_3 TaxID=3391184 RepID=UPI003984DE41
MKTWFTDRISNVKPTEFFSLIEKNKVHINHTFPVTVSLCDTLDKTTAFFIKATNNEERGENYYFFLRDASSNSLIGYVCVKNIILSIMKAELAYFIDATYQGRGIITRAVSEVADFCFNTLGFNKIYICANPENHGSKKVALKNGFIQEGILRNEFKNMHGVLEDVVYYGLLRSEYKNNER